jgi:HEAT repeat protein
MNDEIQALIDSLRRGQYEDPREKISLLSAALQEGKADVPFLLSLLRAPQIPLRLAALDACRERPEPDLLAELALLVDHSDARARLKLAEVLCGRQQKLARETLLTLLGDADEDVREAACKRKLRPTHPLKDKGCGGKLPDKTLGADVTTDVVVK